MRKSTQNLFIFAKSYPLVKDEEGNTIAIGDYSVSKFELRPKIDKYFEEKGVEIQVMYDFLNA